MRTFIAIDISAEAKKEIEKKLYKQLKRKHWAVRWEKTKKLHLTLAFLGQIEKEKLTLVKSSCKKAVKNILPLTISFKGLGCFSGYDYPRIIWLGLKGDLQALAKIQKNIERNLLNLKFKPDIKPFSPHITLGRVKKCSLGERREIGRQLKNLRILDLQSRVLVDKVVIYESKLSPKGSSYLKLAEIFLN